METQESPESPSQWPIQMRTLLKKISVRKFWIWKRNVEVERRESILLPKSSLAAQENPLWEIFFRAIFDPNANKIADLKKRQKIASMEKSLAPQMEAASAEPEAPKNAEGMPLGTEVGDKEQSEKDRDTSPYGQMPILDF